MTDDVEKHYNMIVECAERYVFETREDGSARVTIEIAPRFRNLWLVRLDELTTTPEEIAEHES